jgi:hypothetical protein
MSSSSDIIVLLNAQTTSANGTTKVVPYSAPRIVFKIWGTWNGATVALQVAAPTSVATGVWIPLKDKFGVIISYTADGMGYIEGLVYDEQVRAVVTNAGGSTSVSATFQTAD